MTPLFHRRLIAISLGIYFIATWCTMAGMEIFGWLTFLLTVTYALRKEGRAQALEIANVMPWKICLSLLAITIIGLLVNGTPNTNTIFDIGAQRWIFLLASGSLAMTLCFPTLKGYRVFLIFTSITAVYALVQCATGIDLVRPGEHRAVQPLFGMHAPWRSAGWFGLPLHYAYIAGQHVCLPFAMVLLTYRTRKSSGWLFWGSLGAALLIAASIGTTFTRGAWISVSAAFFVMALIAAPRIAIGLVIAGIAGTGLLMSIWETFRLRMLTLIDPTYFSNSERVFLWKANLEMFKDYPFFGIGYLENENRAGEYVTRMGHPDAFTGHAHSNYLQFLSGTGLTGFLTYLTLIIFMMWLTWRLWKSLPKDALWPRAIALGAIGAQVSLHVGGFTECNFKAGSTNHNFMVVWALVIALTVITSRSLSTLSISEERR